LTAPTDATLLMVVGVRADRRRDAPAGGITTLCSGGGRVPAAVTREENWASGNGAATVNPPIQPPRSRRPSHISAAKRTMDRAAVRGHCAACVAELAPFDCLFHVTIVRACDEAALSRTKPATSTDGVVSEDRTAVGCRHHQSQKTIPTRQDIAAELHSPY
jgi:hypothetical protein